MGVNIVNPVALAGAEQQIQQQQQQISQAQQARESQIAQLQKPLEFSQAQLRSGMTGYAQRQAAAQQQQQNVGQAQQEFKTFQQQVAPVKEELSKAQGQIDSYRQEVKAAATAEALFNSGNMYIKNATPPLVQKYLTELERGRDVGARIDEMNAKLSTIQSKSQFESMFTPQQQSQLLDSGTIAFKEVPVKTTSTETASNIPLVSFSRNIPTGSYSYTSTGQAYLPKEIGVIPQSPRLGMDILTGVAKVGAGISRFETNIFSTFFGGVNVGITKEQAAKTYKLTPEQIETVFADRSTVTGADIINLKLFPVTSVEKAELGPAGKAAKFGTTVALLVPAVRNIASSFGTYRATGATVSQATGATVQNIFKGLSPVQMDTSGIRYKIVSGKPIEVGASPLTSKTTFSDTEAAMFSKINVEKGWRIPTRLEMRYAPTLDGTPAPKTIANLVNYQYLTAAGNVKTIPLGKQFSSDINVLRTVVSAQEIPVKVTKFGAATTLKISRVGELGTGTGISNLGLGGSVSNVGRGKLTQVDINKLPEEVLKGLTDIKLTYKPGEASYAIKSTDAGVGMGYSKITFRKLFSSEYTMGAPELGGTKFFPSGRPRIASGTSVSAPTKIDADIKSLQTDEGLKDFMIQLTKGTSTGALTSGRKTAIGSFKTIDISAMPYGGGAGSSGGNYAYDKFGRKIASIKPGEFIGGGGSGEFTGSNLDKQMFEILGSKSVQSAIVQDIVFTAVTPISKSIPLTKSSYSLKQFTIPVSVSGTTTSGITKQISITTPTTIVSTTPITLTKTTQSTTPLTIPATTTTPITVTTPISITTPLTVTSPTPPPFTPTTPGFLFPSTKVQKRATKLFGITKAYKTLIKRQGKFFEVGKLLSKGEAVKLGEKRITGTLGRTFKVEEMKTDMPTLGLSEYKPSAKEFREFRISGGKKIPLKDTFIKIKVLQTRSEVREIQSARKSKLFGGKIKIL
jgi:hypothetical protein